MHKLILCTIFILQIYSLVAEPQLIHREELQTVKMNDEHDHLLKVEYNISQQCNIENNQSNKVTTPVLEKQAEPSLSNNTDESDNHYFSHIPYRYILGPLGLGACGCLGYALYYAKTKFNLYSLSKACVENALWSVWKQKNNSFIDDFTDDNDQETDLLMTILQTYNTDRYTVAISHFLQDAEHEIDILEQFIQEAESAQSGPFKFAFDDLTQEILQAKTRIHRLSNLKDSVLNWLKKGRCLS